MGQVKRMLMNQVYDDMGPGKATKIQVRDKSRLQRLYVRVKGIDF